MATRRKEDSQTNGIGKGRIKFRYTDTERTLDFSMENVSGDSVREGLRSLANALAGRTILSEGADRLSKPKPELAAPAVDPEEEAGTPEQEVFAQEEIETAEEETQTGDEAPKSKKTAKFKAPALLSNLNLAQANVALAEFMKQKNPTAMWDKYAVVAVWLKQQFQITEISIDHIFTAFKHLGWESQLPTDISKPLKNLTYNRKWFGPGKDKGSYAINWLGEDSVGKMGTGVVT